MTDTIQPSGRFAYQAQTVEGQAITGTIDAQDVEQAQRLLAGLRLRVLEIGNAPSEQVSRGKRLRGDDFIAFNQQLAHLTSAGMPVEQGLRLVAQDMRGGRLSATIRELTGELERGTPLEQAFEKYRDRFPPLYSKLIGAGVTSGNLPGMLLNLGRHMEMVQRLRASIWRAASYPLMVLAGTALVVLFVSLKIVPQFESIFKQFGTKLPAMTELLLMLPAAMPWLLACFAAGVAALILIWALLKSAGHDRVVLEYVGLKIPVIGPVLRYNLLARWCDAVGLGVHAGLDLPRAIELANDAVASPRLRRDGNELIATLSAGKPLESMHRRLILPATVIAAMSLSSEQSDLAEALNTLSQMYQQQSQLRLSLVPALLTPLLLVLVAAVIGAIVLALFMPIIALIQNISSPGKK